jgi:hypothetical protein
MNAVASALRGTKFPFIPPVQGWTIVHLISLSSFWEQGLENLNEQTEVFNFCSIAAILGKPSI